MNMILADFKLIWQIFTPKCFFQCRPKFHFVKFIILPILLIFAASQNSWSLSFFEKDKAINQDKSSFFSIKNRNYISIVGSSTVYPFTAVIAEKYGKYYKKYKTPTVEATGTGGGFKIFCSGIGFNFPDFSNASRQIKASEIKSCNENKIFNIQEIKIGYDGIVLANSKESKKINLTKTQIFLALAEKIPQNGKLVKNPFEKWSQIDKNLPDSEIRVYGPPSTSGTRDSFVEIVMESDFCVNNQVFIKNYPNEKTRRKICHTIRSDGHFIEAGENDNLILQKILGDNQAFGIFGFSFLNENHNKIQATKINGIDPDFQTISNSSYQISRPLFIYFKKEHLEIIDGMKEFVQTILSPDLIGEEGYLAQKGLIPLSDFELKRMRNKVLGNL